MANTDESEGSNNPKNKWAGFSEKWADFDLKLFVENFWSLHLIPSTHASTQASKLLAAIKEDAKLAFESYGGNYGPENIVYFYISGIGRVVEIGDDSIGLAIDENEDKVQMRLVTGSIEGHAVRDGPGILRFKEFPNQQVYDSISAELNLRIESEVLPLLQKLSKVGATIMFAGCAKSFDEGAEPEQQILQVTPFIVEACP